MTSNAVPGAMAFPASLPTRALNALAGQLAGLPPSILRAVVQAALLGRGAALCLHRVGAPPRPDLLADLWSSPESIETMIDLLRPGKGRGRSRLVVSFDDGYASASDYVRDNAGRFPDVTFALFVCPAKIERRVGFRWDLFEALVLRGDASIDDYVNVISSRPDPLAENARPELAGLADRDGTRLATVEECRALAQIDNVIVGNHTNAHIPFTLVKNGTWIEDLRSSFDDFQRLFGPCAHFAIPFGAPWLEFTPAQVVRMRELFDGMIWSTESRTFRTKAFRPGALLPRYAIFGTRSPGYIAARIALRSVLSWVRRPLEVPPTSSNRGNA